jgi:hypothetical protein
MHHPMPIALDFVEAERPSEWLRSLAESARGYADLLAESGELVVAAYRLARARCRTRETSSTTPSSREVRAAALEVLRGVGDRETPVPSPSRFVKECEAVGLLVTGN